MEIVIRRARLIRQAREMGLNEAARAAGVDAAQLSRFERNERGVNYATLKKLATLYRVPIDELLKIEAFDEDPVRA